jgi:transposase
VLEAVLWVLNTGAQWHMLPRSYPNYKTVHRRFQTWCRDEALRRVLTHFPNELRDRNALNEENPSSTQPSFGQGWRAGKRSYEAEKA